MATTEQQTFYDQHPFDWVPADASQEITSVMSRPLVEFIESLDPASLVLDIGCGPGRVLGFLARRGLRCIGLDRSRVSLALAVQRYQRPGTVGDNLNLPFADGTADVVISDGVIHHTENPRAAFAENFRILKPGGRMYLAVYKPSGRYPLLYKFPGGWIRAGLRHGWSKPFVVLFFRVPYFLVHSFVRKARALGPPPAIFSTIILSRRRSRSCPGRPLKIGAPHKARASCITRKITGRTCHSFLLLKEAARPEEHRGSASVSEVAALAERQETA